MKRIFAILVFLCSAFLMNSQEAIKLGDSIPHKSVIVIPDISTAQLDALKNEFEKHREIISATYVYKNHNCLLVTMGNNNTLKYYGDLLKIIQVATNITSEKIFLKTPLAYEEIMGKDDDANNFVVK